MDEKNGDQGERSWKTRVRENCHWIREKSGPARKQGLVLLRRAGRFLWQICRKGGALAASIFRFYRTAGPDLGKQIAKHVRARGDASSQNEICLSTLDDYKYAEWDGKAWDVILPDGCAACGTTVGGDRLDEVRRVPNLSWPLWGPVAGLGAGVVLALFFWSKWVLLLGIVAGFVLGYSLRRETQIRLRYRLCKQHAANRRFPHVRLTGNLLVISVGQHSIKIDFLARERGTLASPAPPTPSTVPESIPLDDGPQATVAQSAPGFPEPSAPGETSGSTTAQPTRRPGAETGPAVEEAEPAAEPAAGRLDPAPAPQEFASASADEADHAEPKDALQQPAPFSAGEAGGDAADENGAEQSSADPRLDEYALAPEVEPAALDESGAVSAEASAKTASEPAQAAVPPAAGPQQTGPSDTDEAHPVHDRSSVSSKSRRKSRATRTSLWRRPVFIVAVTGLILVAAGFAARTVYVGVKRAFAPEIPVLILDAREESVLWHETREERGEGMAYVGRTRCADLRNKESVAVCVVVVESKDTLKEPYLLCDQGDRWESEASIYFQEHPVLLKVPRSQFLWACKFTVSRQPEIFGSNGAIYRCRLVDKLEFWECLTDSWKREVLARNKDKPGS
jgi:hypothetical protein